MLALIPDADIIDRLSLQSRLDTINDEGRSVRSVQKRAIPVYGFGAGQKKSCTIK